MTCLVVLEGTPCLHHFLHRITRKKYSLEMTITQLCAASRTLSSRSLSPGATKSKSCVHKGPKSEPTNKLNTNREFDFRQVNQPSTENTNFERHFENCNGHNHRHPQGFKGILWRPTLQPGQTDKQVSSW